MRRAMAVVYVHYNSSYILSRSSVKEQREITKFCVFLENVNYAG